MMRVDIELKTGWDDCETCGSYDWENVVVRVGDKVVLDHRGDSHMGGKMWYEWKDAVREILTALEIEVEWKEEF